MAQTSSSTVLADDIPVTGPRRWLDWIRQGWLAQAAVSGFIIAVLMHLRYGYMAGSRDHLVLSPIGLQWAHQDWFVGDWAMANAPQPHWLFDLYTWVGAETGTLPALYLLHWLAAMGAFGVATMLLARAWAPGRSWLAMLAVTVVAAVTPIYLYGSGGTLFATGLPGVLGGMLVYLTGAALLVDRHRLAAAAGVAAALVHVQQGAITTVLCGAVAVAVFQRSRRVDRALVGSAAVGLAIVVIGLGVRPVGGHLADFAEACALLIPYHCEASTWSRATVTSGAGMIGLALMTAVCLPRGQRVRWFVVVALPAAAMLGAVAADRWNVPGLGVLVQGLNAYRLAVLLLPLAVWGAMTPVFADLTVRQRWLTLGAVLVLGRAALADPSWALQGYPGGAGGPWMLAFAGLLLLACVAATTAGVLPRPGPQPRTVANAAVMAMVVSVLGSAAVGHALQVRPFDPRFFPDDDLAAWGERVQQIVPPGGLLVIPPQADQLRMATKRAVVVDCKYGPYGGPAWQEFKARLEALGGIGQCRSGLGHPYGDLTAAQLAAAAESYDTGYIVVDTRYDGRIQALIDQGWTPLVQPHGTATYQLLQASE